MADIIQLLPDSIANQIAAGEVIHRPAAVVKELVENAIDANSTYVKLVIKDSGKTLIQVIDNGIGMSDTDARMAFERHATSKISKASDLFHIYTKGFRGEALASVAAIAQVELITKQEPEVVGRKLSIQGSVVKKQEPCQAATGTTVSVKNLFFNVPARRKFLKSDPVELKHIVEEFKRIALAHPEIGFDMYHNDNEVYILPPTNLRQRIVSTFGKNYNDKIIPVDQNVDNAEVKGFVGKPEASKRTKGDQYLFVNNRYIKSSYFHHAIKSAYEELISKDNYPFYCLYLTVDPKDIDINVHPTKTEVKFENERVLYNYIRVAVKHALGQYTVTPLLDFGSDVNFASNMTSDHKGVEREYNFKPAQRPAPSGDSQTKGSSEWQQIYDVVRKQRTESATDTDQDIFASRQKTTPNVTESDPYQIHYAYILFHTRDGYLIIDQHAAHQRVIYERTLRRLQQGSRADTQKELFPRNIHLEKSQSKVLLEILDSINSIGYQIEHFGGESFLIQGTPTDLEEGSDVISIVETLVDDYISDKESLVPSYERIGKSIARSSAIPKGKKLSLEEMNVLISDLFQCEKPQVSPSGKKVYVSVALDEIHKLFIS